MNKLFKNNKIIESKHINIIDMIYFNRFKICIKLECKKQIIWKYRKKLKKYVNTSWFQKGWSVSR